MRSFSNFYGTLILFLLITISCSKETVNLLQNEQPPPPEEKDPKTELVDDEYDGVMYTANQTSFRSILVNATGYNPRNYIYTNPWSNTDLNQNFLLGLQNSEAHIIRYPGGTFTSFWDYDWNRVFRDKTKATNNQAWVDVNSVEEVRIKEAIEKDLDDPRGILPNTVNDLKVAARGFGGRKVEVVFVMNMVTPGYDYYKAKNPDWLEPNPGSSDLNDTWYKMLDDRYERFKRMLIRAKRDPDPIDIKYIEFGNEEYFRQTYNLAAFPGPDGGGHHGKACNYIAAKLRSDTDLNLSADVAMAATATQVPSDPGHFRLHNWNSTLKNALNPSLVNYVTLHTYKQFQEPETYSEATFQQNLADWYNVVESHYEISGVSSQFVRSNPAWGIWYTEINANWDNSVQNPLLEPNRKWAQSLVEAFASVYVYKKGNANMYLQFQFNSQVKNGVAANLWQRAYILKPFFLASRDAVFVAGLSFDATDMPVLPGTDMEVVQGLVFVTPTGKKKCYLVNLSGTAKMIDLRQHVFGQNCGSVQLSGYNYDLVGTNTPNSIDRQFSSGVVELQPYASVWVTEP